MSAVSLSKASNLQTSSVAAQHWDAVLPTGQLFKMGTTHANSPFCKMHITSDCESTAYWRCRHLGCYFIEPNVYEDTLLSYCTAFVVQDCWRGFIHLRTSFDSAAFFELVFQSSDCQLRRWVSSRFTNPRPLQLHCTFGVPLPLQNMFILVMLIKLFSYAAISLKNNAVYISHHLTNECHAVVTLY
jgi:hypothetical protein